MVGNVGVGGNNPVRIQSMTTSNTRDVDATVEQIIRLSDVGCEIARVTVQGMKEAEACEHIKNKLIQRGYTIPVVADIHFYPPAAMSVVDFVDKVRVNPGNFVDKRASFKTIEYDDESYQKEIERIEEKFTPLVQKCKRLKRAMRIGTNHGSLSDRIMNRYGDTAKGMVESALEFARVCRNNDYHDFMFSMKASNTHVMIQAYRMLVAEMYLLGWDYPLHLGVTEAGEGEDGRIKSAIGIGSLLLDGIGETIRVSLTEDPWLEIDPCKRLCQFASDYLNKPSEDFEEKHRKTDGYQKRFVTIPEDVPLHRDGSVMVKVSSKNLEDENLFQSLGCLIENGLPKKHVDTVDFVLLEEMPKTAKELDQIKAVQSLGIGVIAPAHLEGTLQFLTLRQASEFQSIQATAERFSLSLVSNKLKAKKAEPIAILIADESPEQWNVLKDKHPSLVLLSPTKDHLHQSRRFFEWLQVHQLDVPVILSFEYSCSKEDIIIHSAAECGSLLCDGLGDGLLVKGNYSINFLRALGFNILQASRLRSSKTDFISCPGCGRTLFELQAVSQRIRERTSHLPGVKIAIMGCIVNGPGEMADADFGYVGSKPGKIDLYVGKTCVERDIEFEDADERLVQLIKSHGRWVEKV
jgi:(E)-4-hydroxy-3-methylbut-2-enyl-diphosphate synthase